MRALSRTLALGSVLLGLTAFIPGAVWARSATTLGSCQTGCTFGSCSANGIGCSCTCLQGEPICGCKW